MGLSARVNRRWAAVLFAAALIIFWTRLSTAHFYQRQTTWKINKNGRPEVPANLFEVRPLDSAGLKSICSETAWSPDIVFMCNHATGGIAQVRNAILQCVRYAITAGAGIVVPRIINKEGTHQVGWTTLDYDRQDFEFFFDRDHFVASLRRSCPQMRVYNKREELPFLPNNIRPPIISIKTARLSEGGPEHWRDHFKALLDDMVAAEDYGQPVIVEMERPAPVYDIYRDGKEFAREFGDILKFRPDVLDVARGVLSGLSGLHNITFNDSAPARPGAVMGAHMFTGQDLLGAEEGWPKIEATQATFPQEANHYLEHAAARNHTVIYLASNNVDEIQRFSSFAKSRNMKVYSKFDVLHENDKLILNKLTPSQAVLVDYLVLLKVSDFAGIGHSSLSWNVALKRHVGVKEGQFTIGSHFFEDGLSKLFGEAGEGATLFHSMWP